MKPKIAGSLEKYGFGQAARVYSTGGLCPATIAHLQGQLGHQINIVELDNEQSDKEIEK